MTFYVMTLFPDLIDVSCDVSILGRARKQGILDVRTFNIRDYSADAKHKKVDDYPYGGGAGMLMLSQPVYDCYQAVLDSMKQEASGRIPAHEVVYLSPQGSLLSGESAKAFAGYEAVVLLCGHYEGIDERVLEEIVTKEISIGDYVLTGGELPALVFIDAVSRFVKGVLNNDESALTESLTDGLLEYPQYSRPEVWRGKEVPKILLSGDHAKVDAWRREQSLIRTMQKRPDLYEAYVRSENSREGTGVTCL